MADVKFQTLIENNAPTGDAYRIMKKTIKIVKQDDDVRLEPPDKKYENIICLKHA